tara:strand:+ start:760 stop:996 length:237 start_codon:yes stop_codon:yes gene_type:complete
MRTVSQTRIEKRNNEMTKEVKRNIAIKGKIENLHAKIATEKQSIKDCLEQNYFEMVNVKVKRILEMQQDIYDLAHSQQ